MTMRDAIRRIEAMDPHDPMECKGCGLFVLVPRHSTYTVCGCGYVLKEPTEAKK